jgi:long-chain fatty acid transport protein
MRTLLPRWPKRSLAAALALTAALAPGVARAGGFEIPDQGAQALGRGAAFTAKADDGTAIYYNVAGLARQRGTRLYAGANLLLHKFKFTRTGRFPDDPNDPQSPWGGQLYPTVTNTAGPFVLPFVAASTDFGSLDRLTVAIGAFGPSIVGNRTFPLGIGGQPAPSRYDYVQSRSTIIFPTLAAAYRITPWLDAGLGLHLVRASIDQTTISYADATPGLCKNPEYQPCDSRNTLSVEGTSVTASVGVMVRPSADWQLGLQFRGPITIDANGTLSPRPPKAASTLALQDSPASLTLKLPWIIRVGARWVKMVRSFEIWDLETDATYEAWSVQADGPSVFVTDIGPYKNVRSVVTHGYHDLMSFRLGGAYNMEALDGVIALRAGGYFDQSAADSPYTRLDFDTLSKIGVTLGLGYRKGAFAFNLAYAGTAGIPRTVSDGVIRPINGAKGGAPVDADGKPLPPVNNGQYKSFTNTFSVGVEITFDSLFGELRRPAYGDPSYEDVAPKKEEPKPDENKEEIKGEEQTVIKKIEDQPVKKPDAPKPEEKKPEPVRKPAGDPTQGTCKWGEC